MALTYLSVHHQKLKMRYECLGRRVGAVGESPEPLAKGCRSEGDRIQAGFILQMWTSASFSFFVGAEVLRALAAAQEVEMWPSSTPAEGVWKGGSN